MKAKKILPSAEPSTPETSTSTPPPATREQIQALAHAIWIDRGCPQGCDVAIWLEAERQLGAEGRASSASEHLSVQGESVDLERSDAARIDIEMDRVVGTPGPRSPTSL